jgi:hypothetical protein
MKAIDRRLRRLQDRFAPEVREEDFRLVKLLRERRRRRLEASGEPFEELPPKNCDRSGLQSISEILRSRYARRLEIATDITSYRGDSREWGCQHLPDADKPACAPLGRCMGRLIAQSTPIGDAAFDSVIRGQVW